MVKEKTLGSKPELSYQTTIFPVNEPIEITDEDDTGNGDGSKGGRSKRQSAQLASLRNHMLYSNGTLKLANSPDIIDKIPMEKSSHEQNQDISSYFKLNGKRKGDFIEPELAPPQPSYSGLPLESGPNAKIKKESLWPNRNKKKTPKPSSQDSSDIEIIQWNETDLETNYKKKLATKASDSLTNDSKIRSNVRPTANPKMSTLGSSISAPITLDTPRQKPSRVKPTPSTSSPLRSSKRVKITSPKKSLKTASLVPVTTTLANSDESNASEELANDDFCSACGGSGVFICCETCPKSFHFLCCDPPLDDLPEDNWSCRECIAKRNPKELKKWNHIGIFGQLLNQLETINPVEFQLPKKLRDNTFVKVSTDDSKGYDDSSLKPELSYSKLNGSQLVGHNYNHDLEIDTLYDKNGKPYLCHKCGLSGLNKKLLTHCDYCPLVWHLDCLKEPMYVPKVLGFKWRCPNHFENLLPLNLFSKRNLKDTPILDVALHSHFLKIAQNQNLLIKYRDQPYINENGRVPTLHEYLQYELENFNKFNPDYNDLNMTAENTNTLDNDDDIHESYKVPDFFNNFPIKSAVVAKPQNRLSKVVTMTSQTEGDNVTSFVYRVPEELIILDFFSKVNSKRSPKKLKTSIKSQVLKDLGKFEEKVKQEIAEENQFVENVTLLQKPKEKLDLKHLIDAALGDAGEDGAILKQEEILELQSIKKLIESKGKDALVRFLNS